MRYAFILVAETGSEPAYGTEEWKDYAAEYGKFNEDAHMLAYLKAVIRYSLSRKQRR